MDQNEAYDLRLKTPFSYILSGASQSGKTMHVLNFLKYRHVLMDVPTNNIFYFYSTEQPIFDSFKKSGLVKEWIKELPTIDFLSEKTAPFKDGEGSIIILDDLQQQLNSDISTLFTVLCHANRANVILMCQNLFPKERVFRTISLNGTYFSIFKNPRDSSQILHFAKQFSPEDTDYVVDAFRDATRTQYSYLMFDCHQATPDNLRVRNHFLPHELPIRVYLPKKQKRIFKKKH